MHVHHAALVLSLFALACGDKGDEDEDEETEYTTEQGVCGQVLLGDEWCNYPATMGVYTIADGAQACDTTGMFDTGEVEWEDWRADEAADPEVGSDGGFQASLDAGDYAAYHWEDCGGCAAFSVEEGACASVSIELNEIVYADAPNVYLYPEKTSAVRVRVGGADLITASIPEYPRGGWWTIAQPDGRLLTREGEHDYLFYEQSVPMELFQSEQGWCVSGARAQASIEDAMGIMGFLDNEIEDFSDFWDADFPRGASFTVYPQLYDLPVLGISPRPDNLLRAWFVVEPGCHADVEAELPKIQRTGFHAAEWGVVLDASFDRPWAEVL